MAAGVGVSKNQKGIKMSIEPITNDIQKNLLSVMDAFFEANKEKFSKDDLLKKQLEKVQADPLKVQMQLIALTQAVAVHLAAIHQQMSEHLPTWQIRLQQPSKTSSIGEQTVQ